MKPARNCSRLHLTVFNVVRRLALIGDAGGAVQEDGAEFLSSPDAGTLLPGLFSSFDFSPTVRFDLLRLFSIVRFQSRRNTIDWTYTLDFSPLFAFKDAGTRLLGHTHCVM